MHTNLLRGTQLPDPGEPILGSFDTQAQTSGIIRTVASVAAARSLLTGVEAAGAAPTSQYPAYFDIGGVIYRADGAKTSGVWKLSPTNETEFAENNTIDQTAYSFPADGAVYQVILSSLAVRPYDRAVTINGTLYGHPTGIVDLGIHCAGKARYSRFPADGGPGLSTSVTMQTKIPAGQAPSIQLVVRGATAGSSVSLSSNTAWSGLTVVAYPCTMGLNPAEN